MQLIQACLHVNGMRASVCVCEPKKHEFFWHTHCFTEFVNDSILAWMLRLHICNWNWANYVIGCVQRIFFSHKFLCLFDHLIDFCGTTVQYGLCGTDPFTKMLSKQRLRRNWIFNRNEHTFFRSNIDHFSVSRRSLTVVYEPFQRRQLVHI